MEFHKDVLHNFSEFQRYEWLESNALGAYSSSSIIGMNLRREHGLLVVPHHRENKKVVTLAKFEETIFIENRLFEISSNQYEDNMYPHGYQYQEKFLLSPFPTFVYKVEDRKIRKTLFLLENRNLLAVRYELMNQGRPVTLVIKPFIAVRFNDQLNTEIQGLNTDTYLGESFVRWAPRPDMPELYVYFRKGEFITATLWYHGFIYPRDVNKYGVNKEDLFNPGFFQVELKPYEKFDLFVSTEDTDFFRLDFEELYYHENKRRHAGLFNFTKTSPHLTMISMNFKRRLSFNNDKIDINLSLLNNTRNMRFFLFHLPFLFETTESSSLFKNTINGILEYVDSGLLPTNFPLKNDKPIYNQADLSLWLIYILYLYYKKFDDLSYIESIYERLRLIIDTFSKGTTFNIYQDKDGLLFVGDRTINVSWMPLKNNRGEVLRYGKLLEVNALWYNALRIMAEFSDRLKKRRYASKFNKIANSVEENFKKKFVSSKGIAFNDFIHQDTVNDDFRINQIIPLAMAFPLCDQEFGSKLLKRIEEELLTPYGLRSQSIYDHGYRRSKEIGIEDKNEYFSGAVWPWTITLFIIAKMRYAKNREELIGLWKNYFRPLLELTEEGILGYIPEALHFNDRLNPLGSEDFSLGLAAVLWADYLIGNETYFTSNQSE